MKAIVYQGNGLIKVEDRDIPKIGAYEALMRVRAAAICGTDLRIISSGHQKIKQGEKIILSHEMSGDIVDIGSKVKNIKKGMRVSMAPVTGCGLCDHCIVGNYVLCKDYRSLGVNYDGGLAEYMRIPPEYIFRGNYFILPENLSYEEAALAEPLATVINGASACNLKAGDIVLIVGSGPIGILHLLFARLCGAQMTIVLELMEERRKQALEFGADNVFDPESKDVNKQIFKLTNGKGADVIIIAASSGKAQEESLQLIANNGCINFFGTLPKARETITINSNIIHYKNIKLTGTSGANIYHYRKAISLLSAKKLDILKLISGRFKLGDAEEAFRRAKSKKDLKIIFKP